MSADINLEMHEDHRTWERDISCWRDDIALWQGELSQAITQMDTMQKLLREHEERLLTHASSIRLNELEVAIHEHALANAQLGVETAELPECDEQHLKERTRHENQRARHEAFKTQHHTFIARWNLMLKALANPSQPEASSQATRHG